MPLNITVQRASGASHVTLTLDPQFDPQGHPVSAFDKNPKSTAVQGDIVVTWDPAYFTLGANHLYGDEELRPVSQTGSSATWNVTYTKYTDRTLTLNLQCRSAANGPSTVSVTYDGKTQYGQLNC